MKTDRSPTKLVDVITTARRGQPKHGNTGVPMDPLFVDPGITKGDRPPTKLVDGITTARRGQPKHGNTGVPTGPLLGMRQVVAATELAAAFRVQNAENGCEPIKLPV
jgi:hypothetical protein